MRANELRLGNWVNYRASSGTTFPIQVVVGTIREVYERPDSGMITPIPLTEEVLLKCGFVWDDFENDPPDWLCWKVGTKSTLLTDRSCNFSFIEFATSLGRIKVQHLHQLQNLYFALTGQELTYTP